MENLGKSFTTARLYVEGRACPDHPFTKTFEVSPRGSSFSRSAAEPRKIPTFDGFSISLVEELIEQRRSSHSAIVAQTPIQDPSDYG